MNVQYEEQCHMQGFRHQGFQYIVSLRKWSHQLVSGLQQNQLYGGRTSCGYDSVFLQRYIWVNLKFWKQRWRWWNELLGQWRGQKQTSWGRKTWLHSGWSRSSRGWRRRPLRPGCSAPSPCLWQRHTRAERPGGKQVKKTDTRLISSFKKKEEKSLSHSRAHGAGMHALRSIDYLLLLLNTRRRHSETEKQNVLAFQERGHECIRIPVVWINCAWWWTPRYALVMLRFYIESQKRNKRKKV